MERWGHWYQIYGELARQQRIYFLTAIVQKFIFAGVLFGMLFPIIAILFLLYEYRLALSFDTIVLLHRLNNLLYMIDTAPIFLGLFASVAGIGQAALQATNQQLEVQVVTDELTQIPNRLYGMRKLQALLAEAAARHKLVGIMAMDLDRFKTLNDNVGHWFGDQLLIAVAQRLQKAQQTGEYIARLGSDEFMVLVETNTISELRQSAGRYIDIFHPEFRIGDIAYKIDVSMGISVFPHDGADVDDLFKHADVALAANKRTKKNPYEFFTVAMLEQIQEAFVLEKELQGAIVGNELSLVYQPIMSIDGQQICAVEALLRWDNPRLGRVSPAKFIPAAEHTNLIVPIGEWVLRTACQQAKAWQEQGLPPLEIAVNVSANQLHYPEFIDTVWDVLQETGLAPAYIKLEITESVSMGNLDDVKKICEDLKAIGVKFSIDDFGTGYSSLAELKALSVHDIKIDKSFIDDLQTDSGPGNTAIIEAIVVIAKKLNMRVVAEGVETEAQAKFLQQVECDYLQGYLLSKPLEAADFTQFYQQQQAKAVS